MVCLCVYRVVMFLSRAKIAEPNDMLIAGYDLVGPRNHVLDGDPDISTRRGSFVGFSAH